VHLCKSQPENLIVFIHGFSGTAEGTWMDIASELRSDSLFRSTDFLFIGYDSTRSRVLISARLVGDILQSFVLSPWEQANLLFHYMTPRLLFENCKVIVICHSLGAALMRRIAIDFSRSQIDKLANIELVLFAPAHKGASIQQLLEDIVTRGLGGGLLAWARNITNLRKQALIDLRPNSEYISALERDTESEIAKRGALKVLVAKATCFGVFENVVEVADFAADPIFKTLDGENHTTLVKTSDRKRYVLNVCRDFFDDVTRNYFL
jgi:hypothetical protein